MREITVELDGFKALMDERDRRYTERDSDRQREMVTSWQAVKDQTAAAFAASKDAIAEANKAQDAYNITHNDLVRQMERESSDRMPRHEVDGRLKALDDKLDEVKAKQVETSGARVGAREVWGYVFAVISLVVAAVTLLMRAWRP